MRTTVAHAPAAEYITPELEQLLALARTHLNRHHCGDQHNCVRCQKHWPCPTARLAADTLATL